MKRHLIAAAVSLCTATTSTLTGCAGADRSGPETAKPSPSLWSPIRKCRTPIKLCDQFEAQNPGIHLKFVTLPENEARAKITMSTATGGREFDVVMISNYETRQWAHNGWLTDLWNEFFFAMNLTAVRAQTMPVLLVGFIIGEGLYCAKLCAAATMAALPVVLAGWIAKL